MGNFRRFRAFVTGPLPAALLLVAALSCTRSMPGEMVLTTPSYEARTIFIEARWKYETFHTGIAIKHLQMAVRLDPEFAMAHTYLGLAAPTAAQRSKALIRALQLSKAASSAEQLFIQAVVARADGNPKLAANLMSKVSKIYPGDSRPSYFAGLYYYEDLHELDMASEWLNRSRANAPLFPPTLNTLGYLHIDNGDPDKAESVFSEQLELLPNEPYPYCSMGDLYTKAGRYEEAVNYYAKAMARDSTYTQAQRNIGINLVWGHRYEQGRKAIMKSMEIASTDGDKIAASGALIRSYLYEGKHGEALDACRDAVGLSEALQRPGLQASYELLGSLIYIAVGNFPQSQAALQRVQAIIDGADMPALAKLELRRRVLFGEAVLASRQSDYALAKRHAAQLLQSIQQASNQRLLALYHLAQGKIDLDQGKFITAIDHLELADMDSPYDVYYLALAYGRVGSDALAESLIKKVAAWNSDSEQYALVRADAIRRVNR